MKFLINLARKFTKAGEGETYGDIKIAVDADALRYRSRFMDLVGNLPNHMSHDEVMSKLNCDALEALKFMALCDFYCSHVVIVSKTKGNWAFHIKKL